MSKPQTTKPTTPTPQPQPKTENAIFLQIPDLKPKNKRGENPKSHGIYFLYNKEEAKTEEEVLEKKGYSLIPKIKEAVGSNNLKALVVATMETYLLKLKEKGLIKEEEETS